MLLKLDIGIIVENPVNILTGLFIGRNLITVFNDSPLSSIVSGQNEPFVAIKIIHQIP